MNCPHCHQYSPVESPYCPFCGRAVSSFQAGGTPVSSPPVTSLFPGRSKSPILKYLLIGFLGIFLFGCLISAGIVGFVFYQLKNSEANRMAVKVLKENPEAKAALGEIQSVGWPIGNFKLSAGGSGNASFSMSVKGEKGKGKYYATLFQNNGLWRLSSARLQLEDGRSIPIASPGGSPYAAAPPADSPEPAPAPAPLPVVQSVGGRQLVPDPTLATGWKSVEWPGEGVTVKMPPDWFQDALDKRQLEFRSPDRKAYVTGNVVYFDQKIPFDNLIPSLLQRGAGQLQREEIDGYGRKDPPGGQGYWEIQKRGDGATHLAWTTYVDTPQFGTKSYTFLVGAPTREDFQRNEALLATIIDSIAFR